jgi:rhodanese-related sulfurtransferase
MQAHRRQAAAPEPAIPRITVGDLATRLQRGEPTVLLDVRQPAAFEQYPNAIPGSLRIAPGEIPQRYAELPTDRTIVAYCT